LTGCVPQRAGSRGEQRPADVTDDFPCAADGARACPPTGSEPALPPPTRSSSSF
jgi:hypothetical protein